MQMFREMDQQQPNDVIDIVCLNKFKGILCTDRLMR